MSRITLKPLDDGQKAVEIPVGKTTIGRGPFLGCSDKKVSRNHAVLEVTSKGEVYLTPTHVNPCFYQPTADSPGQILKKDIPHKLENGDSFSLLPRAFRYQLIVAGEDVDDKNDQNDLNKQSGKTNGAAADCEEALLNERSKDKAGKGISNEELNDGNTVTEKPFSKEDEILANIDKTYSKEENTFAKKIADITEDNKSPCPKEDKEINEDKESEKEEFDPSTGSKSDVSNEEKPAEPSEVNKDDMDESENKCEQTKNSESCSEEKVEDEKSKFSEKIIEEESTLGNDSFPKDKTENEHTQSNDKTDSKNVPDKSDKKSEDVSASNGDDNLDKETAKDFEGEDEKTRTLPDWMESDDMPPPKGTKKRGPKRQAAEKKTVKRKQVDEDTPPKPKGRKKSVQKFTFDDEGEGSSQRNTPGRTSSRTNRQTRQGLSLGKGLHRKWKSLKDSFVRNHRAIKKRKSGDAAENTKKYVFARKLEIITRNLNDNETEDSLPCNSEVEASTTDGDLETPHDDQQNVNVSNEPSTSTLFNRKKKLEDKVENYIDMMLKQNEEAALQNKDDDFNFFLSLMPSIKKLSNVDKLKFRSDVLQLMVKYTTQPQCDVRPDRCDLGPDHNCEEFNRFNHVVERLLSNRIQQQVAETHTQALSCTESVASLSNEFSENSTPSPAHSGCYSPSPKNTVMS